MKREWTNEDIKSLEEMYPIYGAKYCGEKLNRTEKSIQKKVATLGLKKIISSPKYLEENFKKTISESKSYTGAARNLGIGVTYGNRQTIKKYIEKYNIDISRFDYGASTERAFSGRRNLEEILVKDSTYYDTTKLKKRLYDENLKNRECELCGQGEIWMGKKMSLRLDHINGINNDNRLINLQIICPNCDATLDTFFGKNVGKNIKNAQKKVIKIRQEKNKNFCKCGKEIDSKAKMCVECSKFNQRKVKERPSYEQLKQEIEQTNFSATGRKYGVSDNCIRKWIKQYEK